MCKLDALWKPSEGEKSGMDAHIFKEEQLLYLDNGDNMDEEDAEHMHVERMDVAT